MFGGSFRDAFNPMSGGLLGMLWNRYRGGGGGGSGDFSQFRQPGGDGGYTNPEDPGYGNPTPPADGGLPITQDPGIYNPNPGGGVYNPAGYTGWGPQGYRRRY